MVRDVKPGVRDHESLDFALIGATGVSVGSAHTIPRLLMPDTVNGRKLIQSQSGTRTSYSPKLRSSI